MRFSDEPLNNQNQYKIYKLSHHLALTHEIWTCMIYQWCIHCLVHLIFLECIILISANIPGFYIPFLSQLWRAVAMHPIQHDNDTDQHLLSRPEKGNCFFTASLLELYTYEVRNLPGTSTSALQKLIQIETENLTELHS